MFFPGWARGAAGPARFLQYGTAGAWHQLKLKARDLKLSWRGSAGETDSASNRSRKSVRRQATNLRKKISIRGKRFR